MTDPYSSLCDISPEITVHNICGRFSLSVYSIDLQYLASKIWNASYNPRRLPAIVMRKTKPRATILLFSSGRVLVIGAESMEKLEEISRKVAREVAAILSIKKLHAEGLAVTNIMAVGTLGT
jgi:transcription initiation factor TFIID TATA-box-binding protein